MSNIDVRHRVTTAENNNPDQQTRWLAIGGIFGAVLASSCCIVPLLLALAGVSGAWIGTLTRLEPYKPYFAIVTLGLIGAGFWHVYLKPKPACEEGSYCARPASSRLTKAALWTATVIVLLALTVSWWAPLFY